MSSPDLEVADIFRDFGPAWRRANAGHAGLDQMKVMSAVLMSRSSLRSSFASCARCRTAALGGHVARCKNDACGHTIIAYNSCRNRPRGVEGGTPDRDKKSPKCQSAAARDWLADREAELLPVGYFHVVFTLPAAIADTAFQNKRVIYGLLVKASAQAMLTIAANSKHLGAKIGMTSVLHTWGSAMTHHPHVHMIVPGGGISPNGSKWISCRPKFILPVRVLSRLFRRVFLQMLDAAHANGRLTFHGSHAALADKLRFDRYLKRSRKSEWVVYAKEPFGGPKAVLAYLARGTHRVAISNRRLVKADKNGITFMWKDYRIVGAARYKTMTLPPHEFIRRFLMHVLPKRFHRIRHYGLLANANRTANVARARELPGVSPPATEPYETPDTDEPHLSP